MQRRMMLDPALLTSKSNEPSLLINEDMQTETIDPTTTRPKAEVRLVIKFTVEEQLVYKGKVERTQLLDSEELSRIVSHVAWEESKADHDNVVSQDRLEVQSGDSTELSIKDSPGSGSALKSTLEIPPLATGAAVSPTPEMDTEFTCSDPSKVANHQQPQHSNAASSQDPKRTSIAQSRGLFEGVPTTASNCDSFKIVDKSSTTNLAMDRQTSKEALDCCLDANATSSLANDEYVENVQLVNLSHDNGNTLTADDEAVNQLITETLNDCVNRVDLEIRNYEEFATSATVVEAPAFEIEVDSRIEDQEDIKPDVDVLNVRQTSEMFSENHDTCQRHPNLEISQPKLQSTNISSDKDLISKSTAQIAEVHSQMKRKDADTIPAPAKRIRRASTREQQNSRQRLNSSSQSGAVAARLSSKLTKPNNGNSANNQPVRQKIFAKWSDNHFYPGTILRPTRDRKYVVGFYDGAQRNVAETDLIPLCNIHGKQVRVSIAKNYCVNAIVHEQRESTQEPMFDVEYQQDGLVRKCVPLKDIFLTGDQGTPLISQPDRNSGASNFADVDLDNIIYEKRSRRLQELEDYEFSENSSIDNGANRGRRKRGKYNMRNPSGARARGSQVLSPVDYEKTPRRLSRNSDNGQELVKSCSPDDSLKTAPCPDSNPPSEGSSSTGSSHVLNGTIEFGQEFYFADSSPHRTKTSLLL